MKGASILLGETRGGEREERERRERGERVEREGEEWGGGEGRGRTKEGVYLPLSSPGLVVGVIH